MADYLRIFSTMADYEAYIAGSYDKPNVSYIEATGETIYTNYEDEPTADTVITGLKIADFTGTNFNRADKYITEAVVPEGVTTLKNYSGNYHDGAFSRCSSLTKVTLPSTLTTMESGAFFQCFSLTDVNLKDTALTSIGVEAFYQCTALTSIDIPSTVTYITNDGTKVNSGAFQNCTSLTSVNFLGVPTLTAIGSYSFQGCTALTSIDIPSTVTIIGDNAFRQCGILASITVNATTPPTFGSHALTGTSNNLVIHVPAESVDTYKAASGWSTYASKIQAIPSE